MMKDQVKVRRIGSEIEITVRDQTIILWNDVVAKDVAKAILNEIEHTAYMNIDEEPSAGDTLRIKGPAPSDLQDGSDGEGGKMIWPVGKECVFVASHTDDGEKWYLVDWGQEPDSLYYPDLFRRSEYDIVRVS